MRRGRNDMNRSLCLAAAALALNFTGCAGQVVSVKQDFDFHKIRRVAVLGFEDFPQMPGSGKVIGGAFEKALLQAGANLVERRQIEAVLKEQNLDLTGALDPKETLSLGKILNVDALVLGTLTVYTPENRGVVMVDIHEKYSDPIFKTETYSQKVGSDTWRTEERTVVRGYQQRSKSYQVPQTYVLQAEVGASVRMVDVQTGEILWVGTSSEEALNSQIAAEALARRVLRALKKVWPATSIPSEKVSAQKTY